MPWADISCRWAEEIASTIEDNEAVKSHLTFGSEYDSVLEWFIKTEVKTLAEVAEDSTKWGNYWNSKNSRRYVVETGSRKKWCVNNIYDFAGNVKELTQEGRNGSMWSVYRGGSCMSRGDFYPAAYRTHYYPQRSLKYFGFRAVLYIK